MSQLMIIVNEYGKVVEAKALDSEGKIGNIEYGDEEKKTNKSIIGARGFIPQMDAVGERSEAYGYVALIIAGYMAVRRLF